jgi:hypothetical protein
MQQFFTKGEALERSCIDSANSSGFSVDLTRYSLHFETRRRPAWLR